MDRFARHYVAFTAVFALTVASLATVGGVARIAEVGLENVIAQINPQHLAAALPLVPPTVAPGVICGTNTTAPVSTYSLAISSASGGNIAANSLSTHIDTQAGFIQFGSGLTPQLNTNFFMPSDKSSFLARSKYCSRDMEVDTYYNYGYTYLRLTDSGDGIYFFVNTQNSSVDIGIVKGFVSGGGFFWDDYSGAHGKKYLLYSANLSGVPGFTGNPSVKPVFTFGVDGFDLYAKYNGVEFVRIQDYRQMAPGRAAMQLQSGWGMTDFAVRNFATKTLLSDYATNTLDPRDFGVKQLNATGTIAAASRTLTLQSNPGFIVGDYVIVEIGGEAGQGLRGSIGVGGVWPSKTYPNLAAMQADTSRPAYSFALRLDTGDVYQWVSPSWQQWEQLINAFGYTRRANYYTGKGVPISLRAQVAAVSGNTLTLSVPAVVTATNASVYYDNANTFNKLGTKPHYDYFASSTPDTTWYRDLGDITPDNLTIKIPAGTFAIGEPLLFLDHIGLTLMGMGSTSSIIFSPKGVPSAGVGVLGSTGSLVKDFQIYGNFLPQGFGLNYWSYHPDYKNFTIDAPSVTTGSWVTGGLGVSSSYSTIRNIKLVDTGRALGAGGTDVWAYNIDSRQTAGHYQYIGWEIQWADTVGGGCVDCSATNGAATPSFEGFKSTNVSFIRPVGVNAVLAMNDSGGFLIKDANFTMLANSANPLQAFTPRIGFIDISSNTGTEYVSPGTIDNPTMKVLGYTDANGNLPLGITISDPNYGVTILGGSYTSPNATTMSSPPGAVISGALNTVVDGIHVIGKPVQPYQMGNANIDVRNSTSIVKNCVADAIVAQNVQNCTANGSLPVSTKFSIGDRVQTTSSLNVRATPSTSGTLLGTQVLGALGTILSLSSNADGFAWWSVNYDSGVDGYSVEDFLSAYTAPPPPSPTASLSASPTSITSGQSATLTYSSTNATSCVGTNFVTSGTSGSVSVSPNTTTTYTVTCTGAGGSIGASATVTVSAPPSAPTVSLSASPTSITSGQSTTLTFSSTNATSCSGTNFSVSGTSGSVSASPSATTNYSISCSGAGGSANASATVTVSAPPPPTAPTATLSASPTSITSGQSATLTYSSTNATSCVGTNFVTSGTSGSVSVSPTSNTTYSVTCTGAGGSTNASATVTVAAPAAPTASLSASPTSITSGQSSTLTYSSTNATSCTGTNFSTSGTSGSVSVAPSTNTTYTVTCNGAGGSANASATVTVSAPPPSSGPVVHWKFDENSGSTASDSSGAGQNATLLGSTLPVWSTGQFGNALSFNNSGYVASAAGNWGFPGSATISLWAKPTSLSNGNLMTFEKGGAQGWLIDLNRFIYSPSPQGPDDTWCMFGNAAVVNTWNLFTVVIDRSAGFYRCYLNGTLKSSGAITQAPMNLVRPMYVGARGAVPDGFFSGLIDDVRIYNSALTAGEISALFATNPPPPPPPPSPTASLSASPTSITSGQSSTLTYSSTNATSCVGTNFSASGTSGSVSVAPSTNTTYTVTCTGAGGSIGASASVTVSAPPPATPTASLSASPTSITSGQSSTLTWSSTNATSCSGTNFSPSGTSGSASVSPTVTTTYSVTCTGAGGSANASASVGVSAAPDTTAPSVPSSLSGSAVSATQINLSWSASTDAVGVVGYKVFRNGVQVATVATTNYSDATLAASTAYTYNVAAYDAAGNTSAQASVSVSTLPATASFSVGDRILTTAGLNVRATPTTSGTLLGTQSSGALGILLGGPTIADGFIWWNLNYDSGADGWSVQDYLTEVTPIPTASLSANPTSITLGQPSTLTWSSTNATSCTGTNFSTSGTSGSVSVSPNTTTTYTITCTGAGGSIGASASVTVSAPPPAPTASLSASPTSITSGQSTTLTFSSTNATSCVGTNFTTSGTSGSASVSPTVTTTYSVTCTGAGGSTNASASVTVSAVQPPPPPPPPPAPTVFKVDARVKTGANLNVRSRPGTGTGSSRVLCVQPLGKLGTIISGPSPVQGDTWWYVQFDTTCSGYVVQTYLTTEITQEETTQVALSQTPPIAASPLINLAAISTAEINFTSMVASIIAAPFSLAVDSLSDVFFLLGIGR